MNLRLRLSLFARIAVAAVILLVLLALLVLLTVFGSIGVTTMVMGFLVLFDAAAVVYFWDLYVACTLLLLLGMLFELESHLNSLKDQTMEVSEATNELDRRLSGTVGRLARHAGVPEPTVVVTRRSRPEAFSLGSRKNGMVVVSVGLVDILPDDELEAVLAHEVSHLRNGDSRVMAAALAPVVLADDLVERPISNIAERIQNAPYVALLRFGQFGAAIVSRSREWTADAGAVALTGSPAALASALARLDDHRGVPNEDLRVWSEAFVALDVLPTLSPDGEEWPFPTHPPTADRIERLQRLAAEEERR